MEDEKEKMVKSRLREVKVMLAIGGIPFEDDKKKYGVRELKGKFVLHDDESWKRFLEEWEE